MWTDLASAVVYLLPGFIAYELIYRQWVPGRRQSQLRTTVYSLGWSLAIDAVTVLICGVPFASMAWTAPGTIIIQMALAIASGLVVGAIEARYHVVAAVWTRLGRPRTPYPDVWRCLFASDPARIVYVRLSDGSTYYGAAVQFTEEPDDDPKELLLTDVWFFAGDEAEPIKVRDPVYIRSDAIAAIELD